MSPVPLAGKIDHLDHTTNPDRHEIIVTLEGHRNLYAYSGPRGELGNLRLKDITPDGLAHLVNDARDARANADKSGFQPDTIYYTTGRSRPSQAFYSTDGGRPWNDVTPDFGITIGTGPDFNKLIANPRNLSQLFLATSTGVYRSDDGGVSWYAYSTGLRPNEDVQDIVINIRGLDEPTLYAGTNGRGFWKRVVH